MKLKIMGSKIIVFLFVFLTLNVNGSRGSGSTGKQKEDVLDELIYQTYIMKYKVEGLQGGDKGYITTHTPYDSHSSPYTP